jgi:hypothetical protein
LLSIAASPGRDIWKQLGRPWKYILRSSRPAAASAPTSLGGGLRAPEQRLRVGAQQEPVLGGELEQLRVTVGESQATRHD